MAATFYFKAVASDGKVRTGRLGGETDKAVARELRKQGLTPVYVGAAPQKSYDVTAAGISRRPPARCPVFYPGAFHVTERRHPARSGSGDYRRAHRASAVPRSRPGYFAGA